MAASSPLSKLFLLITIFIMTAFLLSCVVGAQVDESSFQQLMTTMDALEWPTSSTKMSQAQSLYDEFVGDGGSSMEELVVGGEEEEEEVGRRSLFWRAMHYYISYGALSANRIPCPPRSGRSYYTHNCFNARGPVHPYTRGCSRITRCRR